MEFTDGNYSLFTLPFFLFSSEDSSDDGTPRYMDTSENDSESSLNEDESHNTSQYLNIDVKKVSVTTNLLKEVQSR